VIDSRQVLLILSPSNNIQTGAVIHQYSCKMGSGDYVLGGVKMITKFYILPRLRMRGVYLNFLILSTGIRLRHLPLLGCVQCILRISSNKTKIYEANGNFNGCRVAREKVSNTEGLINAFGGTHKKKGRSYGVVKKKVRREGRTQNKNKTQQN